MHWLMIVTSTETIDVVNPDLSLTEQQRFKHLFYWFCIDMPFQAHVIGVQKKKKLIIYSKKCSPDVACQ